MKRNAVAWAALVVSVAALVGSRSYTTPATATQDIPADGQKVAADLSRAFHAVAEFVKPSVVQINVEKSGGDLPEALRRGGNGQPRQIDPKEMEEMLRRFFGPGFGESFRFEEQQFAATGTGSGFVYDDKGHILTNNHVVQGAETITVTFYDGVQAKAKVVGTFPEADVAVIRVENASGEYRPVRIGRSEALEVGEWVLAFGSPFGLSQTVTAGIVSATEREDVEINRFESFIQTDASINPGNSGGPLVNMNGKVVGINSAIATTTRASAGVGFAIPIDMAKRLADKLISKGKIEPLVMGIQVNPVDRGLARQLGLDEKTEGVLITEVVPGTPAEKAGLKVGDVITSFDGHPVHNLQGLQYLVTTSDAGTSYEVKYLRDGKERTIQVAPTTLEKVAGLLPAAPGRVTERPEAVTPEVQTNDFGLAVTKLDDELAEKYGWADQGSGLVVAAVKPGSPAAASGIEVGDLITRYIQDREIKEATSVDEFAQLAQGSEEISIYVEDVRHRLPGEFKTLRKTDAENE